MPITIDWPTKVINVPKSYMTLVQSTPSTIYHLDIDPFRLDLKDIEDSEEGMVYPDTHAHNTAVTVGGVTLARVVEIINGYTITFEDDQYAVNLSGANSNIADVTNVNQVSVRSANSAGLVDLPAIQQQSYTNAAIWIDTLVGGPGTSYPKGTPPDPVDNYDDAQLISDDTMLTRFHLRGAMVLDGDDSCENTEWEGISPISSILVFSGQSTQGATFAKIGMTGDLNGRSSFDVCSFDAVTNFSGIARECGFKGNIQIDPNNTENVFFYRCTSVIAGTGRPELDVNDSVGDIHLRGWIGGITIKNFTTGSNMSIDCDTGTVELDATCTAGTVKVRMTAAGASLIDNSGVGCVVIVETVPSQTEIATSVWNEIL